MTDATLQWDGRKLYRLTGYRRELLGWVSQSAPRAEWHGWMVSTRYRDLEPVFLTIDDAKEFLELGEQRLLREDEEENQAGARGA